MPADNAASNVRVTQAVLKQVVETNTIVLEKVNKKLDDLEGRTRKLEIDHARLDTTVKTWGGINSVGAMVAGVLGYFGIKQ
jgi:hypothetical protein